jgi:ribokinase
MNTEQNTQNSLDFIAIGDMVIDAFIRLNEDSKAHIIEKENGAKEIAMPFGDKIPFEFAEEVVAVGNSANAAVSAARLGLNAGLVVNMGKDRDGEKCLEQLNRENVSVAFVKEHEGKKTNYHYVLWYRDERTILIKHEQFDYSLPDIGKPKCIYLSSVSENALPFHDTLATYLGENPEVKLVFQPGTFQMKWGTDALERIYQRTDIFFCNVEEAERILKIKSELINKDHYEASGLPKNANGAPTHSASFIKNLLDGLRALGPKLPIITDGPNGAYTYGSDGTTLNTDQIIHLGIYPDIAPPYERTGAGDAFASTFSCAYLLGNSTADSLKWASINSMNVCQHVGAQKGLLKKEAIEAYLAKAPEGWDVKVVS